MKALPEKFTRASLLALPSRPWDQETTYDSLFLVPTGKKHDSGYMLLAVVGVTSAEKVLVGEIAATCDDVCWSFPTRHPYDGIEDGKHRMIMRTDCLYPSGIIRIWASGEHYFRGRFRVGCALSSTDVTLIIEPRGDGARADQLRREMGMLQ